MFGSFEPKGIRLIAISRKFEDSSCILFDSAIESVICIAFGMSLG
jgi:hypothetical protein